MNPHNVLTAIDPPCARGEGHKRRWRCHYCNAVGTLDEMTNGTRPCTHVYPPCEHCGETPTCTANCPGLMAILSSPKTYLAGLGKPIGDA